MAQKGKKMAIYVDVPVREDRLAEVFKLLITDPLEHAAEPTPLEHADHESDQSDDDFDESQGRDDASWDAFWSIRDNVQEHLVPRSDLVHAIIRAVAEHAKDDNWITTDDIAAAIGASSSSVGSAMGPLGRYLATRRLGWPMRWRRREGDNKIEYQMAPAEAAVILDTL